MSPAKQPASPAVMTAGLAAALCSLFGCAPVVTLHGDDVANAPAPSMRRVDDALTRHSTPADGLSIHATLWDASLVAAAALDAEARGEKPVDSDRWAQTYLDGTSFTVVIEVEDRRPVLDADVITNAATWRFGLDCPGTARKDPDAVELLLIDRFPTRGGRYHHRLALSVHFAGSLHALAATAAETTEVRLWVGTAAPSARRRSPWGAQLSRQGTTLRWRLQAS